MPTTKRRPISVAACCPSVLDAPLKERDAQQLASAFAALSDPVGLRLLSLIAAEGEICACDLVAPVGKSQPTVSHHLKVLHDAGILTREQRGRWAYFRVKTEPLRLLSDALAVHA